MKYNSAEKVHIASYNELFEPKNSQPKSPQESEDGVREIALSELHPFKNHPFKVLDDEDMQKLVDSIQENGVLMPAIVRHRAEGGYEIIAGHRRCHACEIAGLATIPAIINDLDDNQATIVMVDSNIQRPNILPSERAFAYKMKLDAIKQQGKRSDLTSCQVGTKSRADAKLAESVGDSARTVQRFIRLTELITPLLDMADGKKIALNAAVEISYLKNDEQSLLLDEISKEDAAPSLSQAQRLKKFSQDGKLTENVVEAILTEGKGTTPKVTLHGSKLQKYFPSNYTPAEMEAVIFGLLDKWKHDQEDGPHG